MLGAHSRNFQDPGYRNDNCAALLVTAVQPIVGSGEGELAGTLGEAVTDTPAVALGVDVTPKLPHAAKDATTPSVIDSQTSVLRIRGCSFLESGWTVPYGHL